MEKLEEPNDHQPSVVFSLSGMQSFLVLSRVPAVAGGEAKVRAGAERGWFGVAQTALVAMGFSAKTSQVLCRFSSVGLRNVTGSCITF